MPRPLCFPFACLLMIASPALAETDGEVYEEADKIFTQAAEEIGDNLAKFVEANERPLARARTDLATLIKRMNEERRPEVATALQKRLNTLEDTIQKRASARVPIVEPSKKSLVERLEGKWVNPAWANPNQGAIVKTFDATGKFTELHNGKVSKTAQLEVLPDGSGLLRLNQSNAYAEVWAIGDDVMGLRYWTTNDEPIADGEIWFREGSPRRQKQR